MIKSTNCGAEQEDDELFPAQSEEEPERPEEKQEADNAEMAENLAELSAPNAAKANGAQASSGMDELRKIVGTNDAYYLPEFEKLARNEKSKFNWAAFFLNGAFSYYRKGEKIFWKYCKKFYILMGGIVALAMLLGFLAINSLKTGTMDASVYGVFGMLLMLVYFGVMIYGIICLVQFAGHFNEEYYRQCTDMAKTAFDARKSGTSVGRGFLFYLVVGGVVGLIMFIFGSMLVSAMLLMLGY